MVNDNRTHEDAPAGANFRQRRLTSAELLALQLRACGYLPPQCCSLAGHPEGACVRLLEDAAVALGADDQTSSIIEAQRRGLIL